MEVLANAAGRAGTEGAEVVVGGGDVVGSAGVGVDVDKGGAGAGVADAPPSSQGFGGEGIARREERGGGGEGRKRVGKTSAGVDRSR